MGYVETIRFSDYGTVKRIVRHGKDMRTTFEIQAKLMRFFGFLFFVKIFLYILKNVPFSETKYL